MPWRWSARLTRSLPVFFRAQQAREFIRRPTRDLHRSTVGIVGFGGVGRRLAEVLSPFKTRILATDMFPVDKPARRRGAVAGRAAGRPAGQVDVLFLAAPLTDRTRGMIDAARAGQDEAGRDPDQCGARAAGGRGRSGGRARVGAPGGGGLDVTEVEPLPPTADCGTCPTSIITPHVGGQSRLRIDQMTDFFCENLRRYLAGQPLANLVDKQLGFPVPRRRRDRAIALRMFWRHFIAQLSHRGELRAVKSRLARLSSGRQIANRA